MNSKLIAGVLFGAVMIAQTSMATTVTLNGSIASGTTLGAGNYTGQFDGRAVLPDSFKINSASFVFNFADDQDVLSSTSASRSDTLFPFYTYQSTSYDGANNRYAYVNDASITKTVQKTGTKESASVSLGGVNVGSGATSLVQTSTTTSASTQSLDYSIGVNGFNTYYFCGFKICSNWVSGNYNDYYTDTTTTTTTNTTDWTGAFAVGGSIVDQTILNQLLLNQQVNFGLAIGGDLILTGAHLVLDITEIKRADVPEPASVLLMGLGLAGLVAQSRRRRTAASVVTRA